MAARVLGRASWRDISPAESSNTVFERSDANIVLNQPERVNVRFVVTGCEGARRIKRYLLHEGHSCPSRVLTDKNRTGRIYLPLA